MKEKAFLVREHGERWARNTKNIGEVPRSKYGGQGVYVLYDGAMPVYIGKGNIHQRICKARLSKKRGRFWNYFSWYIIPDRSLIDEVEAFLLRMLPWYLKGLNRQSGKFVERKKLIKQIDPRPETIPGRSARPK